MTNTTQGRDWPLIAKRIKTYREAANLTQPELAAAIGRHRATIARIETGVPISEGVIHSLAKALGVDYKALTGHDDPLDKIVVVSSSSTIIRPNKTSMIELFDIAKDLAQSILDWEKVGESAIPLGEVLKVNAKARHLKAMLDAVSAGEHSGGRMVQEQPPHGSMEDTEAGD